MQKRDHKILKRPRVIAGAILTASVVFLAIASLLMVNSSVPATMAAYMSGNGTQSKPQPESTDEPSSVSEDAPAPADQQPKGEVVFARPDQVKGVWLNAGTDYLTNEQDAGEAVKTQIDTAFAKLAEWGFNTVLVPVSSNGRTLYESAVNLKALIIKNADGSIFDIPAYIAKSAKTRGIFAYGVLDLRMNAADGYDPTKAEDASKIHNLTKEAVTRYSFDGWLLDNAVYASGSGGSYADYMKTMPGAGFDRFRRDSITAAVTDAVNTVKAAGANLYVGLLADPVWANSADDERGSQTSGVYAAYTDGFADTRAWVAGGLFDFVMVKNGYSTTNNSAPFGKILDWWTSLCGESGRTLYIQHDSGKVCGAEQGWKSPDQLAQQVLAAKSKAEWKGSVFSSFSALLNDKSGSTQAVLNTFGGKLNEQYISRKMVFSAPTKTSFTTYESKISIRGSADPNFPLTMNGKPVELSDHGFFAVDIDLSIGKNTFVFNHKGTTITYNISYLVVVIQSVEPASGLTLDGGTTISITANAYKGSSIYAKLGSATIKMDPSAIQKDEDDAKGEDSDYINYSGSYKLPAGIDGKTQNLGTVVVYGNYKTLKEQKNGGSITVKAKPVIPPIPMPDENGVAPPVTGKLVMINRDYAETFTGNTTDDWSRPTNAYLPKGTVDVIVSEAYDFASKSKYYILGCGRRVYQSNVLTYQEVGTLTENSISLMDVSINAAGTNIKLGSTWKVPYNFKLLPQTYGNIAAPDYSVANFTASYVDITFSYTTAVSGTPDVSKSTLFKSAEWIKGKHTNTLRLFLHNAGKFYGYSVNWDNDNNITFNFKNPTDTAEGDKPLAGKRIVIDPGHGGNSIGTAGGNTSEKVEVLKYGIALRDKLTALGATVIMTRTTDVNPDNTLNPASMDARTGFARNGNADLFLSIHMDGAGSSARGYTVFYFNEYSKALASFVGDYAKTAYSSVGGVSNRSNTVRWYPYFVTRLHDCPAVLIECGFMSNTADLELLISDSYREKLAQAMADGIVDYFKASPVTIITNTTTATQSAQTTAAVTTTTIVPAGLIALSRRRKKSKCLS